VVAVSGGNWVTHINGDLAVYLDVTFACSWLSGEPGVGDDESVDVRWWPVTSLPDMSPVLRERIDAAFTDEVAARYRS
jgi:hypothetical protein